MADGSLIFDTSLNTDGLQKGAQGLGGIAKNALGVFAGNMMTKATEAVTNLGKEALSSGMSFETGMAKVNTLFTGTDEQFSALSDQILQISSSTGLAADGLAEAAYSAESAGVPMENLGTMLESSAKLASAGFTDMDTALSATAKTMNAYGMSGEEDIGKVQKVLMQTQNLGITTVGELGASLAQVTPTAAAFGVSFDQVGASLAVMTAQGTPTAQATTQLNSVIAELGKTGTTASKNLEKAAEGTKYAGMSFSEMMDSGADLGEVLGMISDQADKDGVSMVDMFSSIEAGKAAMAITSGEGAKFKESLAAMSTEADVVGEGFETMSDTLKFKTQRIKTAFSNMAIGMFNSAAGPLADAADTASNVVSKLSEGFESGGLVGMAAAAEHMMQSAADKIRNFDWSGAADSIVQNITSFINGGGVQRFLGSAGRMVLALSQGIGQTLPKLLPAVVKLVAYLAQQLLAQIPVLLAAVGNLLAPLGQAAYDWLQSKAQILDAWLEEVATAISTWFSQIPETIGTWLSDAWNSFVEWGTNITTTAGEAMSNMISTVVDWITQLPGKVWTWLVNTVTKFKQWRQNVITTASDAMSNMLSKVIEWISQLPGKVWTWLSNTIEKAQTWASNMADKATQAGRNFVEKAINGIKELPGKIESKFTEAISKAATFVSDLGSKAVEAASGFVDKITSGLAGLPGQMLSVGSDLVNGIWTGIQNGWGNLVSNLQNLAGNLVQKAKDALKIGSPSRVFRDEVGQWIPAGMAVGITRAMPDAIKTMQSEASSMVAGMRTAVNASMSDFTVRSSGSTGALALAGAGATIYNDYHTEQENTYNVPVASPSEVARTQREALRKMVGGVQ